MGYFSNGTEGEIYEHMVCRRCIHAPDYEAMTDCPVLTLHSVYNYDQFKDETAKAVLEVLIPTRDGRNEQCAMFSAAPPATIRAANSSEASVARKQESESSNIKGE